MKRKIAPIAYRAPSTTLAFGDNVSAPRIIIRQALTDVCAEDPSWGVLTIDVQRDMIRYMERSCHNDTIYWAQGLGIITAFDVKAFMDRYSATVARVLYNIRATIGTDSLVARMSSGAINARQIAELSSLELNKEATREMREEIEFRTKQKPSRFYTCSACGDNRTTKTTFHSGASDEADSCIIRCCSCPNFWYVK